MTQALLRSHPPRGQRPIAPLTSNTVHNQDTRRQQGWRDQERQRHEVDAADTPQGLQPHGFSVHRRRHPRDSPKALSAPENVAGRVRVAVQHEAAVRADMGAHRQALRDALAAPAAILRGIRWIHRFHSLPGACCRAREDGEETALSGVADALVEARHAAGPVRPIPPCPAGLGAGRRARLATWMAS